MNLIRTGSHHDGKSYVNHFEVLDETGRHGTGVFLVMRSEKFISFSRFHRLTVEVENQNPANVIAAIRRTGANAPEVPKEFISSNKAQ